MVLRATEQADGPVEPYEADDWSKQVGADTFDPAFHAASEVIGRRWTGAIIRSLFHGETRFRHIADAIPGVSDRILSVRLKDLRSNSIAELDPSGRGYRLTDKGRDLRVILVEFA